MHELYGVIAALMLNFWRFAWPSQHDLHQQGAFWGQFLPSCIWNPFLSNLIYSANEYFLEAVSITLTNVEYTIP